jgi:hypothetical protein
MVTRIQRRRWTTKATVVWYVSFLSLSSKWKKTCVGALRWCCWRRIESAMHLWMRSSSFSLLRALPLSKNIPNLLENETVTQAPKRSVDETKIKGRFRFT